MDVVLGFGLGTLILLVAIAWGLWRYNRRDPANEPITEQATKELYKDPELYAARTHDELKSQVR